MTTFSILWRAAALIACAWAGYHLPEITQFVSLLRAVGPHFGPA